MENVLSVDKIKIIENILSRDKIEIIENILLIEIWVNLKNMDEKCE